MAPMLSRRVFVQMGLAVGAGWESLRAVTGEWQASLRSVTSDRASAWQAGDRPRAPRVKALVFDTFGTVVDWRSSVAAEIQQLARRKGFTVDGEKFADAWRAGSGPTMNRVRTGQLPW